MELTVVGKSPAMPDAGGAQSGYLVAEGSFKLLVECGGGVVAKLRQLADLASIDAVLVSHPHADHAMDLLPLGFALAHGLGLASPARPPLWVPPGAAAVLNDFSRALGMGSQIDEAFTVREYDPNLPLRVGPLTVSFAEVPHYVRAWACDIRADGGGRLTFGADCGPNAALVELSRDTPLLMLEATEGPGPHRGLHVRGHLTAAEAGELAQAAGARTLLLTHYSDLHDPRALRAAARTGFGGRLELAGELQHYRL
jgi:ribonuclease BN (tRNA processing enzyme)